MTGTITLKPASGVWWLRGMNKLHNSPLRRTRRTGLSRVLVPNIVRTTGIAFITYGQYRKIAKSNNFRFKSNKTKVRLLSRKRHTTTAPSERKLLKMVINGQVVTLYNVSLFVPVLI